MLTARDFEARAGALSQRRGRARSSLILALACGALAAFTTLFTSALMLPLAVGAALGLVFAVVNVGAYREAVARLALDPSAYVIPEVSRYGHRFATAAERARLASWLRDIVRESTMAESWCLADRVRRYRHQLEGLAADLARPQVSIRPASAVACRRLLTCGAESPLYNPRIPSSELAAVLLRIRHGIGYGPAEAGLVPQGSGSHLRAKQ